VGLSRLPQIALIGSLHLRKFSVNSDLDAEFVQVGE
jgi:hypothetical protein